MKRQAAGPGQTDYPDASFFIPSLRTGGVEYRTIDLAEGLRTSGLRVELLVAEAGPIQPPNLGPDLPLIDFGRSRVLASLGPLIGYLRRRRPRFLLTAMPHVNLVGLAAKAAARVPTRVVVSERLATEAFKNPPFKIRVAARLRFAYRAASSIIAVSEGVAEELRTHGRLAGSHIDVIPNPVVTPRVEALAREPVRHQWCEPGQPALILGVGRLHRQKNFAGLLEAFERVRKDVDCRLLILGEGPERDRLARQIERGRLEDQVELAGRVDNPYAFMARAALFVLSSSWEGLPGVLIEAMSVGCPVVSTDCPAGPREILLGGRLAPLVPCDDPEALAAAMSKALRRPPDTRHLQERAQDFRLDRVVARYREALGL